MYCWDILEGGGWLQICCFVSLDHNSLPSGGKQFQVLFFPFCFAFHSFSVLTTPSGKFFWMHSAYPVSQHKPQNPRTEFRTKEGKKKILPPVGSFSFLSCKGNLEMFQKHQVFRVNWKSKLAFSFLSFSFSFFLSSFFLKGGSVFSSDTFPSPMLKKDKIPITM